VIHEGAAPTGWRGLMENEQRPRRLSDEVLAEEIEMYTDLVLAASDAEQEMTLTEIDAALGVER